MRTLLLKTMLIITAVSCANMLIAQEVTLPLDRYDELRRRADPPLKATPVPAVPISLDRAWLEIEPSADTVHIRHHLTITVAADGWREIALPKAESYLSADLGELEGRLGESRLTVRGRGRHEIVLRSVARLTIDDSSAQPLWALSVNLPGAAVVAGVVRLPEGMEEVLFVSGGVERGSDGKGGLLFAGQPSRILMLNILGPHRGPVHSTLPLRFTSTSATLIELSRSRHRVVADINLRIQQGELEELRLRTPKGYDTINASGPGVAGWDVNDDGDIVVSLLESATTDAKVRLQLSGPPATSFSSPLIKPVDCERTTYATALSVQGDGLLELVDQASAVFPSPGQSGWLPQEWGGLAALLIDNPEKAPVWNLEWASQAEVLAVQVDRMVVDVMVGNDGQAAYQVWLLLRSSGASSIAVTTPPGLELTGASRNGVVVAPGRDAEQYLFPLSAGSLKQVIHLSGLVPLAVPEQGRFNILLPSLSAPVSRVELRVSLPPGAEYEFGTSRRAGLVGQVPKARSTGSGGGPLAAMLASNRTSLKGGRHLGFFAQPSGFAVLEAAWSAMTDRPAPLELVVSPERTRREWF